METVDVLVIGGGIAGTGVAAKVAAHASVLLVEREAAFDVHSTGRSAAALIPSYGGPAVRALTRASLPWFRSLPGALRPRPVLWVGGPGSAAARSALLDGTAATGQHLRPVDGAALFPPLRDAWQEGALLDDAAQDLDVALVTAALRSRLSALGGRARRGAPVHGLDRRRAGWLATFADGTEVSCGVVVDAAGAWADDVAALAGLAPLGLVPCRRTIAACPVPGGDPWEWPLVSDVEESFYLKPERGQVLVSPADETPVEPGDVRPEPEDVASGLDAARAATTLPLRSVRTAWAGLRTFAPDRVPVLGPDPEDPAFVWCAGQGGYGIQTAPAAAALTAALLLGTPVPDGLDPRATYPGRLGRGP